MAFRDYKSAVHDTNWGARDDSVSNPKDIHLTLDQINTGCMLSIAESMKSMAVNHVKLQSDLDMYKRWYRQEEEKRLKLERRINSLKGVITKLKKKCN